MELDDLLEEVPEPGKRRARPEPEEGSFEEVLREAERMERSDRAKAAYQRNAPSVQGVGRAPDAPQGPTCHFCGDHRRLTDPVVLKPGGGPVRLCAFCARQVEEDRAKRCLACGEPSARRLLDGLCIACRHEGGEPLINLVRLVRRRWVGVIKDGD